MNRLGTVGARTARIALIPFEILFYAACILGLIVAGAVLAVMHIIIALRDRSNRDARAAAPQLATQ